MNTDPTPLEPAELDELLSADLDGELAAAAHERGWDVETARARIASTPHATERRAALSAAREMLAQAPELSELDAARLRARALDAAESAGPAPEAARRARRNRALVAVSGIAACVLVVAGIAFAANRSNSSSSSKNAASPTPPTVQQQFDLTAPVPPLGSYSDVRKLESAALDAAQQSAGSTFSSNARNSAGAPADAQRSVVPATTLAPETQTLSGNRHDAVSNDSATGSQAGHVPAGATTSKSASKASTSCSAAKFAGSGDELLLQASATFKSRPVRVYVFSGHGEHTVVVLDLRCGLVTARIIG